MSQRLVKLRALRSKYLRWLVLPFKLLFPVRAGRHLCMHIVFKPGNKKSFSLLILWSTGNLSGHTHKLYHHPFLLMAQQSLEGKFI